MEGVESGRSVSSAARAAGAGKQTTHKWLARDRSGEPLSDRRSGPLGLARRTAPDV